MDSATTSTPAAEVDRSLVIRNLRKEYRAGEPVLKDVSLTVEGRGMLALIVASLGFLSKLVAEAVEEVSMQQVEAVRATGAPFLSLVIMGVLPQVMPRCSPSCSRSSPCHGRRDPLGLHAQAVQ